MAKKAPSAHVKEDDEFQDFEIADWDASKEEPVDESLWIQDWDTIDLNDDFSRQLRAEIEKLK